MKLSRNHPARAFTFVELLIVIAVLFVLAALLLPTLVSTSGGRSSRINCSNNLKQIGLAFRTWALDNGDKYPMQIAVTNGGTMDLVESGMVFRHFQVMSNELSTPKILFCPEENDRKRAPANTFQSAISSSLAVPLTNDNQISYFVGVDANPLWLSGDRNLAFNGVPAKRGLNAISTNSAVAWVPPRHGNGGNIGLADGSVQGVSTSGLRPMLLGTGLATNRLAMP